VEQAISGPNTLVIRFPRGYNLPDGGRKAQIEDLLAKVTGQVWSVQPEATAEPVNGQAANAGETPVQRRRRVQDELLQMPLTARVKEVLGATVVEVEEGFGQVLAVGKDLPGDDDSFAGAMSDEAT
jgi:hypothetical protein